MEKPSFEASMAKDLSTVTARVQSERTVFTVLDAAWTRRWFVVAIVSLCLLGAASVLAVSKKKYTAEAVVQLHLSKPDSEGGEAPPAMLLDATAIVRGEANIISSSMIARRVIARLGEVADKRGPADAKPQSLTTRAAGAWNGLTDWIRANLPGELGSHADDAPKPTAADGAEAEFLSQLSVEPDNRSYLIRVRYNAARPETAAVVANAVANEYIHLRAEANLEMANRKADWLSAQIKTANAELEQADKAVVLFREQTGLMDIGADGFNVDQLQLRELASQLSAASLARDTQTSRLARIKDLARTGAVLGAEDLQAMPTIQDRVQHEAAARRAYVDLMAKVGPQHPSAIQAHAGVVDASASLATEVSRTIAAIELSVAATKRTEQSLRERLQSLVDKVAAVRINEAGLRNRQAVVQSIRDRITALTRNYEQVTMFRDLRSVAASLILPAEPVWSPSSPKPLNFIAIALFGGLGFGITFASILERRARGLRSSDQVRRLLETRCLGMVPALPATENSGKIPGSSVPKIVFDEAVRAVGAGAGLFATEHGCLVVLVTSSVANEGASALCQSLAELLVLAGRRVLRVDGAPLRHARSAPATSESACRDVQIDAAPALSTVASGDIFSSGELAQIIDNGRMNYDLILLEGPPVMLVADSLVLARYADKVLHVVQWGVTPRRIVEAALRRLQEHAVAVDGVVLTDVDLQHTRRSRTTDPFLYYINERRFYEHLSATAGPVTANAVHTN